jgi:hypothetical protein
VHGRTYLSKRADHSRWTTDPQQTKFGPRWVLRGVCVVATFYSCFFAAHGLLMTGQFLNDEIPAGRIEAILGTTKTGPRLRLDNGKEVVFSSMALFQQPKPVELAVGDRVEKRADSTVYLVNGKPLTNLAWLLHNWLIPTHLLVTLGVYLVAATAYVLIYGRTPIGDCTWTGAGTRGCVAGIGKAVVG